MSLKDTVNSYLKLDELKANIVALIEAKIELKKLEVQEKVESAIAPIVVKILLGIFAFMSFLFLNILLANYLNTLFNNIWGGYLIMFTFYLIPSLIIYFNMPAIEKAVGKKIGDSMDEKLS